MEIPHEVPGQRPPSPRKPCDAERPEPDFHPIDNERLICYSKHTEDLSDTVLVVVNPDPHHRHGGGVCLPLITLGAAPPSALPGP